MRMISLDCASFKTGFAVWIDGKLIEEGLFIGKNKNTIDRILEIKQQLLNKINQYEIKYLIPEEVQMHGSFNPKTARDLAWLQGVILSIVGDLDLGIVLYPSNVWRALNGYTGANNREKQKQWAVDKVNELYGFDYKYYKEDNPRKNEISDDDKAEAILIGLAYLKESNSEKDKL